MLKRTLDLPARWAAMVTRSTGDHTVVAEGGTVEGQDADDVLFARMSPIDLDFEEEGLITRDRFSCRADVHLQVGLIADRGEMLSFIKTILGSHRVAQNAAITNHLKPAVRSALMTLAKEHDANELVNADQSAVLSAALSEAIKGACFEAGLRLEGTPTVQVDSKTLRQIQQSEEEALRHRREHSANRQLQTALERAQSDHAEHLTSLLGRLGELAQSSPEVELPELIRTFPEQQRGELYTALFATETPGDHTRWIVVAAGDELLFFDPQSLDGPARRVTIDGPIGGVRSIQVTTGADGRPALLLGAATGVYRLPIDGTSPDITLSVPYPPAVKYGFNAAVGVGDRVFASHSELGLCEWNMGDPEAVRYRFQSMTGRAASVRHVQFFEANLYCSVDDRVIGWPADDTAEMPSHVYTGSSSAVTALCATSYGVYAGNSDGDILLWTANRETEPECLYSGYHRAAESLWVVHTGGIPRIIFADTSPRLRACVLGDSFTCEYEAGGQTLRRVEVAPDLMAVTNELRDRLICFKPGQPDRPWATVQVSALCRRSIQDVCLVPLT
ncbi:MAG: hypothetical protein JSU63_20280 [Phycisphaerales bacterium]|nr:MAG: hypothetical protein JSU63_20280 [Phycisphaerales bacterium]